MASTFTCQTCLESLEDLGRHLSQTRHKSVLYDVMEEPVECEECGDTNIHLLHMLRYGLSDMALLCSDCLLKQSTQPLAQYSLSNGSLFQKLPQYYKFRDIQCEKCHKETNLSVANDKGSQRIFCHICLKENAEEVKNLNFVSEDSDDFLFALLGIKEYVPKPGVKAKGRQRKVGRKGGRLARPKKVDPNAEQRKAHYENKKAIEAALKSGKTIKAVGSGGHSPAISRTATPNPLSKSSLKSKPSSDSKKNNTPTKKPVSSKADYNDKSKPIKQQKQNSENKPTSKKALEAGSRPTKKQGATVGSQAKQPKKNENVKEFKDSKSNKSPESKELIKKFSESKTRKSRLDDCANGSSKQALNNASQEMNGKVRDAKKSTMPNVSAKPANTKSQEKPKREEKSKANYTQIKGEDKSAKNEKSKSKSPKNAKVVKANADRSNSTPEPVEPSASAIVLPPGISKYEPSKVPKLTYDSMDEYLNEMCYNLFLEEKASMFMSHNSMLTAGEFELEWYADQDKKYKQFKLNILLTPEILDRYVSRKMQSLKKTPFSVGQSLMLVLGEDIPWYGNIVLAEAKNAKSDKPSKFKKGRRPPKNDGPKVLEIIVELYEWNKQPLPLSVNVNLLSILPVSIPVSRVFLAMSRILNPRFIDMILGKKPIRQIFFKNYLNFTKDTFNDSQKVAIQSVLNNSITVLQGPPGTGKTSTIYEIILQLLENLNTFPILVVAASNIAIDNIAEKLLLKHGRSILRIVSNEKEPEYTRDHPLSSICLHHKVFDGLPVHLQQLIKDMRKPGSNISQTQYKKLLTAQIDFSDKLIALARVIFTTTVVAGGNQLKSVPRMPVVIMDEATQSSEPTTLIPLSMPGVEKFVFVGDQKQLSSFSQVPNLSLSLFERIISNGSYKTPHMLDTQYRMHPAISEFPRNKFYDGLLKDGITAADRQKEGIPANPVVFWDTCGKKPEMNVRSRFREDSGLTYANAGEIDYVEKVLTNLIFEKGIPKSEIGVITPYRGQRDMISSTLVKNELINPEKEEVHVEIDRDDFFNESKPITIHTVSDIMIASIDAFQGREKDFLIMSCVRSNESNKIGFLNDARRMNVALTRARYGLILIGDVNCLSSADELWKEYLDTLKQKNLILKNDSFTYNL